MIDWSKTGFNPEELRGVDEIVILPTVTADQVILTMHWMTGLKEIRKDVHIEILKHPDLNPSAGDL